MSTHHRAVAALAITLALFAPTYADDGDEVSERERVTEEAVELPPLIITATQTSRDPFEVPRSVVVIGRETVQDVGSFVALKALSRRDAGVWYDERTTSTTDPIIRGFAGFNLLTLIDGNTLSTLWGEGGFGADDMYGKIDPEMVERIEVIRGPNSALYGSNALGAVINVISRSAPIDFTEEGWESGGRLKFGMSSAANGITGRVEMHAANPEFRFLLGGSARDFDDVRGGGRNEKLAPSDGNELNWDFSGEWRVAEGRIFRLTVQDVHRENIKRYYRPTQDNMNDREAIALFFTDERGGDLWDRLEASVYYQDKEDERRFFDTDEKGRATTETWQVSLRATRDVGSGHVITGGYHMELTDGDSPDDEQFTRIVPSPRRRAAPLSSWDDFGLYAQDEWRIDETWSSIASVRYDRQIFKTRVDDKYVPPIGNPQDDDMRDSSGEFTGGVGVMARATEELHIFGNWARGYRQGAPNFGTRQLGDGILVPNDLLDPTTSDNFELGVKGRYPGFTFEVTGYRSEIDNWQGDLRATTLDGASWLDFNNNGVRDANEGYVTQVEGGDAYVTGIEVNATVAGPTLWRDLPEGLSFWGSFAYNEGNVDATKAHDEREPLRHTQPTRALLGIRWDDTAHPERGLFVEAVIDMVDRYDDIPSDRQEGDLAWRKDPQDGTSPLLRSYAGTPGYTLLHLYAGMDLADGVRLRVGIENVFDKDYRVAHSRMDAPGLDAFASLEILF